MENDYELSRSYEGRDCHKLLPSDELEIVYIQSNLSKTATRGRVRIWLLQTGGCLIQVK